MFDSQLNSALGRGGTNDRSAFPFFSSSSRPPPNFPLSEGCPLPPCSRFRFDRSFPPPTSLPPANESQSPSLSLTAATTMPFNLSTRWLTAFILLFSLSSSTSCCALATPGRVSVTTSRGVVDGYSGVTSNRFVLPYAQSPTASRRFRDPVTVGSLAA